MVEHLAPDPQSVSLGTKSEPGVSLFTDAVDPKKMRILTMFIPYGKTFPDDLDPMVVKTVEGYLQKAAFLRSSYARKDQHHVPRQIRKQIQRDAPSKSVFDPTIRVVTLRRPSGPGTGSTGPRNVEWKSQWWVTGHYRKQWCPSTKTHRVVWIAPYLKGPEDKPIKEKVYDVVR